MRALTCVAAIGLLLLAIAACSEDEAPVNLEAPTQSSPSASATIRPNSKLPPHTPNLIDDLPESERTIVEQPVATPSPISVQDEQSTTTIRPAPAPLNKPLTLKDLEARQAEGERLEDRWRSNLRHGMSPPTPEQKPSQPQELCQTQVNIGQGDELRDCDLTVVVVEGSCLNIYIIPSVEGRGQGCVPEGIRLIDLERAYEIGGVLWREVAMPMSLPDPPYPHGRQGWVIARYIEGPKPTVLETLPFVEFPDDAVIIDAWGWEGFVDQATRIYRRSDGRVVRETIFPPEKLSIDPWPWWEPEYSCDGDFRNRFVNRYSLTVPWSQSVRFQVESSTISGLQLGITDGAVARTVLLNPGQQYTIQVLAGITGQPVDPESGSGEYILTITPDVHREASIEDQRKIEPFTSPETVAVENACDTDLGTLTKEISVSASWKGKPVDTPSAPIASMAVSPNADSIVVGVCTNPSFCDGGHGFGGASHFFESQDGGVTWHLLAAFDKHDWFVSSIWPTSEPDRATRLLLFWPDYHLITYALWRDGELTKLSADEAADLDAIYWEEQSPVAREHLISSHRFPAEALMGGAADASAVVPPGYYRNSDYFLSREWLTIFNEETQEHTPIKLPPDVLRVGEPTFIRGILYGGPFLRVTGVDDCLPVRAGHSPDAEELACAAERVLLTDLGGDVITDDGPTWRMVRTPAGIEGWADDRYLE